MKLTRRKFLGGMLAGLAALVLPKPAVVEDVDDEWTDYYDDDDEIYDGYTYPQTQRDKAMYEAALTDDLEDLRNVPLKFANEVMSEREFARLYYGEWNEPLEAMQNAGRDIIEGVLEDGRHFVSYDSGITFYVE